LRHGFFHIKTARFVRWHHSLPNFGSEIALSARMSAPSFAGSPRCAFTSTKKVAVPTAILFRSISMAAARISASGAPTNNAFPPSPIHLSTAFNNDWLSHKYSNPYCCTHSLANITLFLFHLHLYSLYSCVCVLAYFHNLSNSSRTFMLPPTLIFFSKYASISLHSRTYSCLFIPLIFHIHKHPSACS